MAMFGNNWIQDSKDESENIIMGSLKEDNEKKPTSIFSKHKKEDKEIEEDYEPIIKHFIDLGLDLK